MKQTIASSFLALFTIWSAPAAWAGEILSTVGGVPSALLTPLGLRSNTVERKFTYIGCYDYFSGRAVDCGYDFRIRGLSPDAGSDGGHSHDPLHPLGLLQVTSPVPGDPATFIEGQTSNALVIVSHELPTVSGKLDTVLNVRVPPGWHTVSPESLDDTRTSWRFVIGVDVAVPGLISLSGAPCGSQGVPVVTCRGPDDAHKDAVAFFGTGDALIYLRAIADNYLLTANRPLSVNDMSLIKGGVFDLNKNYTPPHSFHRTGQSADINKGGVDCIQSKTLRAAVNDVMPPIPGSPFAVNRTTNSQGRFLCEEKGTKPTNNIHIDFDVQAPPSPSPFQ